MLFSLIMLFVMMFVITLMNRCFNIFAAASNPVLDVSQVVVVH